MAFNKTSFSTLSTIELKMEEMSQSSLNINTGKETILSQAYMYFSDALSEHLRADNENIDIFFQRLILEKLQENPIKSKALVFFAVSQNFISLYVCSKNTQVQWSWLSTPKELSESQRDYLPDNSVPYLYWDGKNLFRLHQMPENYRPGSALVSDFGSMSGLATEVVSVQSYEEIANNLGENTFYSLVPQEGRASFKLKGNRTNIVEHIFYNLI